MNRREFLARAVVSAAVARTATVRGQDRDRSRLARVAIMSLGFNSILKNAAQPDDPARTLDILDLPQMLAGRYGVHNVELQHSHLPSTEAAYLGELRDRLARAESRVTNINLEFGPQNISAADPLLRQQAIDRTKEWIDAAAALGCPRIMVNQGTLVPESKDVAIAALKAMSDYGRPRRIMVAMEK